MTVIGRTYVYETYSLFKAHEVVNEFMGGFGRCLDSKIEYEIVDLSDDVEQVSLGALIRIRPPYLHTRKSLEKSIPSLKAENITCLWSE